MGNEIPNGVEGCKGIWSRDERRYSDRLLYTLGKVVVGCVDHPIVSKGEPRTSKAVLHVPGIALRKNTYSSDEEAKVRVESAFRTWLSWLRNP